MTRKRNRRNKQIALKHRSPLIAPVDSTQEPIPIPMGRTSTDAGESATIGGLVITEPSDHESSWRLQELDTSALDTYSPREILDMLIDLSPEVARATWDFQRLCNPGWEYKVYEIATDKEVESENGKLVISEFMARLRDLYGSVDVVFGRLFIGAYLRGAFCAELVIGSDGVAADLATPDPFSIRFRRVPDPQRGSYWQAGQLQGQDFTELDIPTFKYLPVDPAPASPYGRSLAAPSLFTAVFLLTLLHDVKRIIMQQGYPRMDIIIDGEQAIDSFSYDPQGFATLGAYITGAVERVRATYGALQPDDAFIHTDMIKLGESVGTANSDTIGAIALLTEKLEKTVTRGLKSNSLIMDTGGNTGETDSNRRWEIHSAGVKSLQHLCENMLESLLSIALQARGVQARIEFRFAELRASEMFRDEQTRTLRIQNSRAEYEAGYTTQDESSINTVGHIAAAPAPLVMQGAVELVEDNSSGNEDLSKKQDGGEKTDAPATETPKPTRDLEDIVKEAESFLESVSRN